MIKSQNDKFKYTKLQKTTRGVKRRLKILHTETLGDNH